VWKGWLWEYLKVLRFCEILGSLRAFGCLKNLKIFSITMCLFTFPFHLTIFHLQFRVFTLIVILISYLITPRFNFLTPYFSTALLLNFLLTNSIYFQAFHSHTLLKKPSTFFSFPLIYPSNKLADPLNTLKIAKTEKICNSIRKSY
jgi:hypothetical protein